MPTHASPSAPTKRPPLGVTTDDAALELGITKRRLLGLVRRKELKALKLGPKTVLILRASLDELRTKWERMAR